MGHLQSYSLITFLLPARIIPQLVIVISVSAGVMLCISGSLKCIFHLVVVLSVIRLAHGSILAPVDQVRKETDFYSIWLKVLNVEYSIIREGDDVNLRSIGSILGFEDHTHSLFLII